MTGEVDRAVTRLLDMVPSENPADTAPMWAARQLARSLLGIEQRTLASIKAILARYHRVPAVFKPLHVMLETAEFEQVAELLTELGKVVEECRNLPAAGGVTWAHARREFSDALREWEQDQEIINLSRTIIEAQWGRWVLLLLPKRKRALADIERALNKYYELTPIAQRLIIQLSAQIPG